MLTSQINPGKFKLATELGMTQGVNPKDHADKSIQSVLIEMSPTGWGTCTVPTLHLFKNSNALLVGLEPYNLQGLGTVLRLCSNVNWMRTHGDVISSKASTTALIAPEIVMSCGLHLRLVKK